MDSVKKLTGADFENDYPENLKNKDCTIVLFYADWCGHCQNFKPVYNKFAESIMFLNIAAIDIDLNRDLIERMNSSGKVEIKSFPTLIKYSNGKPVGEINDRQYSNLVSEAMELCNSGCRCNEN